MISMIRKLFLKEQNDEEAMRAVTGYVCGGVGIILNLILFVFKLVAGLISGSIAIMADAINNLSDAGASIVTLLGFFLSGKKPDKEHPYGHGRIEYVSGFIVSILILIMAWSLIVESVKKIVSPKAIDYSVTILIVLGVSILVKLYMAYYNYTMSREINSVSLLATARDSLNDCLSTGIVLVVTFLSHYTGWTLDGWAGFGVGCVVALAGINTAKDTLNPLLGLPPEAEFVKRLEEIAGSFDEHLLGMHDLMIHDYGPNRKYVSFHAEVPRDIDILELHEIIDALEKKIGEELKCFVTIHMDPIENNDENYKETKARLEKVLEKVNVRMKEVNLENSKGHKKKNKKKDNPIEGTQGTSKDNNADDSEDFIISMHDFRMVSGENRINLIFDIVLPPSGSISEGLDPEQYIRQMVKEEMGDKYETVIQVDHYMGVI